MNENELSKIVFDAGLKIHRKFGPGLYETAYEACLEYELVKRGLKVEKQLIFPLRYEDLLIEKAYRIDLLIEDKLIIEVKTVSELSQIHFSQILTYLKLLDKKLGLLINFNVPLFKDGVRRVSNGFYSDL